VGQQLLLPGNATVPADRQVPLRPAPETAPLQAPYLAETTITIEPGDTLWDLSEERLSAHTGAPPGAAVTVQYLDAVIAASPDVVEDPDLIYAGEQFRFPALGSPPIPEPPAPAQPPTPPPEEAPASAENEPPPVASTAPTPAPEAPPVPVTAPARGLPGLRPEPVATPAPAAAVSSEPVHASDAPIAIWLASAGGATALASGLVLLHRRSRDRSAAAGAANLKRRASRPGRQAERSLVAASNLPLVRWANHELAEVTRRLDPATVVATPVAVEISETHGLELLWDAPVPTAPPPWEARDGGWAWRILYDPDLHIPASPDAPVLPGLVTLGERDNNAVLVDVEALGSMAIVGDQQAAENLLRAVIVELASSEDLANSYVHLVDLDDLDLPDLDRLQHRSASDAIDLLTSVSHDHGELLERHHLSSTFQLRLGSAAIGRELTVMVGRAGSLDGIDIADTLAPPHRGVALIVLGEAEGARATLSVGAGGRAVLEPLGLTVQAAQLPCDALTAISDLLLDRPFEEPPIDDEPDHEVLSERRDAQVGVRARTGADRALDDLHPEDDEPRPPVNLLVRVLGVPSIDGHSSIGRIELNLVTFLACSAGSATESQVIDAVWNGRAIERSTLWNRISKARSQLGGFIPPRDQGSNLVRLSPGFATDVDLLRAALDRAYGLSDAQAVDELREAMSLVTGVPFDAVGYDWAYEQQHYADACYLIERVALTLIDRALQLHDIAVAQEAVSLGLKALRANEPLYRARMRIEALSGNRAGIRHTYNELTSLLGEIDGSTDGSTPSPATTALLEQLLMEDRRTA
jgi:DNA-binding SARP family transcriptional activator